MLKLPIASINPYSKIEAAVLNALEMTPPELAADIYKTGIYLAGGGSLAEGPRQTDRRKNQITGSCGRRSHCGRWPEGGTGIALKNFNKFNFLIKYW
jgi:rod shape-determining protein MreB and related proteins